MTKTYDSTWDRLNATLDRLGNNLVAGCICYCPEDQLKDYGKHVMTEQQLLDKLEKEGQEGFIKDGYLIPYNDELELQFALVSTDPEEAEFLDEIADYFDKEL